MMPVHKFRSVEEIPSKHYSPSDPENFRRALEISLTAIHLSDVRPIPGVHRLRHVGDPRHYQKSSGRP
jgi:hypothetical protein